MLVFGCYIPSCLLCQKSSTNGYLGDQINMLLVYVLLLTHTLIRYVIKKSIFSETCIKRSPLGQRISVLIRLVTSLKSFNSYEIVYDRIRKKIPINTGDCLIEVTT